MADQKKYKISFDRINCIGAGSCAAIYPERWKMTETNDKADLIGGKLMPDQTWEVDFSQEELDKFIESAQVCPVTVIHVIEMETGKKLI